MSVYQNNGTEKASPQLPMVIGAVVLLVAFIGFMAYINFRPQGPVPVKTATSEWLERLARESKGDFSKLSAQDQAKLNAFPPGGQGAVWLKRKYDSIR